MAFNCYVAGLKFDGDFKLGNFCFNGKTRTWYMIDVEEFVAINPDSSFLRCWQKVVRGRRQSEVVDRRRALWTNTLHLFIQTVRMNMALKRLCRPWDSSLVETHHHLEEYVSFTTYSPMSNSLPFGSIWLVDLFQAPQANPSWVFPFPKIVKPGSDES